MSRYMVIVSYDGTNYGGWQKQINASCIQEEIERALCKMYHSEITITASGRTDAGVHAIAQTFHYDTNKDIDVEHICQAVNSLLPKDIRLKDIKKVNDEFHARFDVKKKRYDYLITQDVDNPFLEHYMAKERKRLDVPYMQECAKLFVGTHDFTSFTSNKIDPRKTRVKTILRLEVVEHTNHVQFIFEGPSFLRYMVRMLSQTLIEAGRHRLTMEDVFNMLIAKDKHACRYKAVAQGLYLVKVWYEDESDK